MSKYNLEEIHISNVKENMSADDQARFDNLTKDDQLKLEKIFSMMKAEKDAKKSTNEDFDSVVDKIKDSGKSEEDAKKIAGAINAKYVGNYREGVEESDAADYTEEIAEENDEDKLPMDEDKYDDIVDADSDIPADKKKAAALAYRKVDKGDSYEKATSHIKEVRVDRDVAERIEGLLSIPLKAKFLDVFEDLWLDLIEEDPFYAEDVVAHLSNEMHKQISNRQAQGDRLAGMEESFDSLAKKLDKQKGIDKDEAAKIAGSIAAKKAAGAGKGPTAKQKKRMNEVRIEKEVANRIEGLMNIQLKKQFLDVFEDLWLDLIEEDPFYAEDVIAHLSNEMSKQISNRQAQGDRLADMEESDNYVDEIGEGAMQPGEADLEAGVKGNMDAYTEGKGVDFIKALKVDANGTNLEIKSYLESLKRSGDKFDSVDDYVEDFKNYVADKSLQEHFGRFMKKYQ